MRRRGGDLGRTQRPDSRHPDRNCGSRGDRAATGQCLARGGYAPILSGPQEIRKSTFIKALFGEEWTGELSAHMADDKAAVEQMLGKLCLELPELSSMRKSESEEVKRFMTVQCDRVRLAYDRRISEFPRQVVFMGTTNSAEYGPCEDSR